MAIGLKICPKCGIEKPIETGFGKRSGNRAGQPRGSCKACEAEHTRIYSSQNRNKVRAASSRWKLKNPERVKEYTRALVLSGKAAENRRLWVKANPRKAKEATRRFDSTHRKERREAARRRRETNPD